MPLYFAYGANLDRVAMRRRCPASRPLGPASLPGHRFFIMAAGYASIRPEHGATVHGLLWQLAEADIPALDAFEEVDDGLYDRVVVGVQCATLPCEALVYRGRTETVGRAQPGYLEAVLAAAAACDLPSRYRAELRGWLPAA